jgi:hypothetical protein
MPKVLFVNEHREVEVEVGRKVSDVAAELGISVCRAHFSGVPFGDWTVWIDGPAGCVSPPTLFEKIYKRVKGWRRMANRARILGDCKIYTQQGLVNRTRVPRPVAPVPVPSDDPNAERFDHEHNAAGTAWNPYGHPTAVGQGTREAPKYEPPKKKEKPAKKGKEAPVEEAADAEAEEAAD